MKHTMEQEYIWIEPPYKYPYTTSPATRCKECGEFLTIDPSKHPCGPDGFLERGRKWMELNTMTPASEPPKKHEYRLRGKPHHGGTIFHYDNWMMPSYTEIIEQMRHQTGCEFEFLGCFMDVCSFRTNADISDETYTVSA